LNERSISNLIEDKEDENIMRMREALLKKENFIQNRLKNETPVNKNLVNIQVSHILSLEFIIYRVPIKIRLNFRNFRLRKKKKP